MGLKTVEAMPKTPDWALEVFAEYRRQDAAAAAGAAAEAAATAEGSAAGSSADALPGEYLQGQPANEGRSNDFDLTSSNETDDEVR